MHQLTSQYVRLRALDNYDARFVIVTNGPIDEALAYKAKVGNRRWTGTRRRRARSAPSIGTRRPAVAVNVFLRDGDKVYRPGTRRPPAPNS